MCIVYSYLIAVDVELLSECSIEGLERTQSTMFYQLTI